MNDLAFAASNLTKRYGGLAALDGLTAGVLQGSITGLVGRNGSGKTTLMRIAAGQLDATSGRAAVFGQEPMNNLGVLPRIIYSYHNYPHHRLLRLGDILTGFNTMYDSFDSVFADKLLAFFGLTRKLKYGKLSQGMASIFNFLCALAARAPLTLLDEPVLGMDVSTRRAAYEVLLRDAMEHPRAFVISSHLLAELEGILSDLILIEEGRLLLAGPVDDVRGSAYRVDGPPPAIEAYCAGRNVLHHNAGPPLNAFAVIREPLTEGAKEEIARRGLTVSGVRIEDLYVFLTKQGREGELECLWQN
jgi:ABC-2 type transport system ATP-binding protein